jgi:uncharacterized damage-inducible protein DinB
MTFDELRLLYRYDRWANGRTFAAVSRLTPEQFTRDLGGSFSSVRDTLAHIIGGEWIWLRFWKTTPLTMETAAAIRAERDAIFRGEMFPTFAALQERWDEIEREQVEFVESLSEASLQQEIEFRATRFRLYEQMQHLANHSTYHRGQITLMLRQIGATPAATDFHLFLIEDRKPSGAAVQ